MSEVTSQTTGHTAVQLLSSRFLIRAKTFLNYILVQRVQTHLCLVIFDPERHLIEDTLTDWLKNTYDSASLLSSLAAPLPLGLVFNLFFRFCLDTRLTYVQRDICISTIPHHSPIICSFLHFSSISHYTFLTIGSTMSCLINPVKTAGDVCLYKNS